MSFQAYLDSIQAKTGKTPEDFKLLAAQKGLVKHSELLAWLKSDFELGHGHANAMIRVILHSDEPRASIEDQVAQHFSGGKAVWRKTYDALMGEIEAFGDDVTVNTTNSYISLLRNDRKFGIVQVTIKRLDIGFKLDKAPDSPRIEESGTWNAMVTHRVRVENPDQIDADLILWLRQSYDLVG